MDTDLCFQLCYFMIYYLLDVQIQEEERSTEESELDEDAILAAFRQAQKMFHNGTLPQMEQIINLYLDRVVVFPDYVEIPLNNVPTNLLNPSQTKDEGLSQNDF